MLREVSDITKLQHLAQCLVCVDLNLSCWHENDEVIRGSQYSKEFTGFIWSRTVITLLTGVGS